MTTAKSTNEKAYQKRAWLIPLVLGVLIGLMSLLIAGFAGVDMSEFEASTGAIWSAFSDAQPEVAEYIIRLERLAGVGFAGFALIGAAIAWTGYRRGEPWAWYALWLFPIIFGLAAVVFFAAEATGLGLYYGGAAVIAMVGLLLPYRRFFPKQ
ncbi:MAG: hypothetical protein M5R40_06925 [Anaerolineae bacterium]|nr:hypothetical protein [Anaerolineae bacterium]